MVPRHTLQSQALAWSLLTGCWCLGSGLCLAQALGDPTTNLRHPAVIGSAVITTGWMALGWLLMLLRASPDWLIRLVWTLGVLALLFHLILAFWRAHGWSHEAAVEHVREVGGFGGGILVSYLFAVVWCADVVWWWVSPSTHGNRPRGIDRALHAFLLFVVVNATVVFGAPERRLWYAAVFVVLAVVWLWSKNARLHST